MMKKTMILIAITVSVMGSLVNRSSADPITIFGLNWSQEPMLQAVSQMGYTCSRQQNIWGIRETVCTQGNAEILIQRDVVTFNCNVFNGCGYSLREIAQSVVDAGIIDELIPETETVSDGFNTFYIQKYCGRGREGDALCVVEDMNLLGQEIITIQLLRAQFGSGGMSFN